MHALIVGGTRGLGLQLALEASRRNIDPIVTGRSPPKDTSPSDRSIHYQRMNVTDEHSVKEGMERIRDIPELDIRYLFYLPGTHLAGAFCEHSPEAIAHLFNVILFGFMRVVRNVHQKQMAPYHLICISSTTSWLIRNAEAVYGSAKAAQAQFARNFHQELARDLPGSKTLIAHPGGMRTEFWEGTDVDTRNFLDPARIAELIWDAVQTQEQPSPEDSTLHPPKSTLQEVNYLRDPSDGSPRVEIGAKAPQTR